MVSARVTIAGNPVTGWPWTSEGSGAATWPGVSPQRWGEVSALWPPREALTDGPRSRDTSQPGPWSTCTRGRQLHVSDESAAAAGAKRNECLNQAFQLMLGDGQQIVFCFKWCQSPVVVLHHWFWSKVAYVVQYLCQGVWLLYLYPCDIMDRLTWAVRDRQNEPPRSVCALKAVCQWRASVSCERTHVALPWLLLVFLADLKPWGPLILKWF